MRFNARQLVVVTVSVCTTVIASMVVLSPAPVGASTGSAVVITDKYNAALQSRISPQGRLLTAPCDATECAQVDVGALRTDSRMLAPKTPWNQINDITVSSSTPRAVLFTGLGPGKLNLTSFTFAAEGPTAGTARLFAIVYVSNSNVGNCLTLTGASFGAAERFVITTQVGTTTSITYPSPLVWTVYAGANKRYCVDVEGSGPSSFAGHISASGFLT